MPDHQAKHQTQMYGSNQLWRRSTVQRWPFCNVRAIQLSRSAYTETKWQVRQSERLMVFYCSVNVCLDIKIILTIRTGIYRRRGMPNDRRHWQRRLWLTCLDCSWLLMQWRIQSGIGGMGDASSPGKSLPSLNGGH